MDSQAKDGIYLFDLWTILVRHKVFILASIILSSLIAAFAAFSITPVYRSEILLSPVEQNQTSGGLAELAGQFGGLASLAGVNFSRGGNKAETIAILNSRSFTEKFIREYELLPVLFPDKWSQERNDWKSKASGEIPSMAEAYTLFNEKIRNISIDKNTGLITLAIEWSDRELAAEWANKLIAGVNEHLRMKAIAEANESIEFLNLELKKTQIVDLQQVLYRLIENQVNAIMLANVRDQYAFKIIDPATVPDSDMFVKPKKIFIIALGFFLGLFFGVFVAVLRGFLMSAKEYAGTVSRK